jgi:hypothetical protein
MSSGRGRWKNFRFFLDLYPCIGTLDLITKKRVQQGDEKQVGKDMLQGSAILNT